MRKPNVLTAFVLTLCLGLPALARIEGYGPRRYAHYGHGGPGWAGVIAGGLLGAAAGYALSRSAPPVVVAPPVIGTVVPALPPGCVTVPAYNGVPVYNCGNIYYQPFYEGGAYQYEVVPAP